MSHHPESASPSTEDESTISGNEDGFTIIDNEYNCEWDADFQSKYTPPPRNTKEKALSIAKTAAGLVMAATPSEEDVTATAKHMAEIVKDGVTVAVFAAADAANKVSKSDIATQGKATAMKIAAAASANVKKAILGDPLAQCDQEHLGNECPPDIITYDNDGSEWKESGRFKTDEVHYDPLGVSDEWHSPVANTEQTSERRERIRKEWMARPEGSRRRDPERVYGGPELWVNGVLVQNSGTGTRTSHGIMHVVDDFQVEDLQDALAQGLDDEAESQLECLRRSSI